MIDVVDGAFGAPAADGSGPGRAAMGPDEPAAPPVRGDAEPTEAEFYALYAWCLNPLLTLRELFQRFREELDRFPRLEPAWQQQESRINLYLFACAIACTVDDYLAWRPWNLRRLAEVRPRLGGVAAAAQGLLNAPTAVGGLVQRRSVAAWRHRWTDCVGRACRLLVDGDTATGGCESLGTVARELMDADLPRAMLVRRMQIPEGFRCQDRAHQDALTLAARFADSRRGDGRRLAVIGA